MKTKVIMESQNDYAKKENKEFEAQYMRAALLALLESGKINQAQYDECIKKVNRR